MYVPSAGKLDTMYHNYTKILIAENVLTIFTFIFFLGPETENVLTNTGCLNLTTLTIDSELFIADLYTPLTTKATFKVMSFLNIFVPDLLD